MAEAIITVSKSDLARAMKTWNEKADAEKWPANTDPNRHVEQADYLFGLLTGNPA